LLLPFAGPMAASAYVRQALREPLSPEAFRARPSTRFFFGLGVMGISYVLGWPMVALFTFLSGYFRNPALLIVGPASYGCSHLVFLLGLFLTGRDLFKYGDLLMKWGLQRAVGKALDREA